MSIYTKIPDPKLHLLDNKVPCSLLDTHPGGRYEARQIVGEKAAVWDTQTGEIVFLPPNANALCWAQNGRFLLAACEADSSHTAEIWEWAEPPKAPFFLYETPVDVGAGWILEIVASPTSNTAFVVAADQSGGGIEWVAWDDSQVWMEAAKSYWGGSYTLVITHALFSPDGKYAVLVSSESFWWMGDESNDPEEPSPGGTMLCGVIVICESETGMAREAELFVDLPEGFLPNDADEDTGINFIGRPVFEGNNRFSVPLGNGEVRGFSVLGDALLPTQ